jgi:TMEM175 potassium channel family protein
LRYGVNPGQADNKILLHGLLELWPSHLAYAVTVLFIGQVRANHHVMFDPPPTEPPCSRTLLLMVVAFLLFATSVLAGAMRSGTASEPPSSSMPSPST